MAKPRARDWINAFRQIIITYTSVYRHFLASTSDRQKTNPQDPPAGAAKYGGPHPHRHGGRLDDSLSFLNIILCKVLYSVLADK
jgi:hypothetical protein